MKDEKCEKCGSKKNKSVYTDWDDAGVTKAFYWCPTKGCEWKKNPFTNLKKT